MLRRPTLAALIAATVVGTTIPALALTHTSRHVDPALSHPGLARLGVARTVGGSILGVARFDHHPTGRDVSALRGLGLTVQPTRNLPLAYVAGTRAELVKAVASGAALDVYPDERLHYDSVESDYAMQADKAHRMGFTGKGVGIAIVDSGVDATHPALRKRVTHNVKIVDGEYVGYGVGTTDTAGGPLVVPVDQGPYNNSDTSSGHGTHCAGIAAADGTGDPKLVGVAPGANVIGYSAGDTVFVFAVIGAFDDILTHHKAWHIRVVSNSWGSSFRLFDPHDPTNIATKALHDAGLTVVFAAGNDTEYMQINPYSVAPWVIAVASGTTSHERSDFSSGGIANDDSKLENLPTTATIHQHFSGLRLGMYHGDVTAPGTNIVSTGTPTGTVVMETPPLPGGEATASGTSMATPHVAGAAAVLLQARPSLTPDQIREVLQVTATTVKGDSPFAYTGYGFVDLAAAVSLVRSHDFSATKLARLQAAADRAQFGALPYKVLGTDFWQFPAALATVGGTPDSATFSIHVGKGTKFLQALVAYPSLGYVGFNFFDYQIDVNDAKGKTLATSTPSDATGQSALFVDLTKLKKKPAYGKWTVALTGNLGAQDNDTLMGKTVALTVAQLAPKKVTPLPLPTFVRTGRITLRFQPNGATALISPEGCHEDAGAPDGGLATAKPKSCEAGTVGYATTYQANTPATFITKPLRHALAVGGTGAITQWVADTAGPAYGAVFGSGVTYQIDALLPHGITIGIAGGALPKSLPATATPSRDSQAFALPAAEVPKGARLRLTMFYSGVYASTMRLLYGKGYDSALRLGVGKFD